MDVIKSHHPKNWSFQIALGFKVYTLELFIHHSIGGMLVVKVSFFSQSFTLHLRAVNSLIENGQIQIECYQLNTT